MNSVRCPRCSTSFELSDALTLELRDRLRIELQADITQREAQLHQQQEEARKRDEELSKARLDLEAEETRRTQTKVRDLEARAKADAEQALEARLKDLSEAVTRKDQDLQQFRELELGLRKKQRELEAAVLDADLKVQRTLAEERSKIREDAEARTQESHRLKDLEKDKLIQDLKSALDDMKRKADQGSMETQGEVLELDFEERLRRMFHLDDIQPVPRGIRGADLVQMVRTPVGADCCVFR